MDVAASVFVKVRELPDSVFAAISARLSHYTIGFIRLTPSSQGDQPQLLGSGVLVKADSVHAVLTTAHVLPLLPTSGKLCVLLEPTPQPHVVDTIGLEYRSVAHGSVDAEGPDLAAVILAPSIASSLAAKKSFYNLDRWRDTALQAPGDVHDGVWAVQGWLNERTQVIENFHTHERTTRFYNFTGLGGPDPSTSRDGYDYFDFVYERTNPDVPPQPWGGVSGGGLWQIPLKRDGDSITDVKALLRGIAFYQAEQTGAPFSIRCHGIQSVYDRAYSTIAGSTAV